MNTREKKYTKTVVLRITPEMDQQIDLLSYRWGNTTRGDVMRKAIDLLMEMESRPKAEDR